MLSYIYWVMQKKLDLKNHNDNSFTAKETGQLIRMAETEGMRVLMGQRDGLVFGEMWIPVVRK